MQSQGIKRVRGRNIEKTLNPSDATSEQGINPHDDAAYTKYRIRGRNVNSILSDRTNLQPIENDQAKSANNDRFILTSNPLSLREDALLRAVSVTKPSPIKQSLWTTKEAHLSRGPLQAINGNSLCHSHLTPISRVDNFNNESKESGDCEDIDVDLSDNTMPKWSEYLDIGAPDKICSKCQAIMWNQEKNNKSAPRKPPTFSLYCKNGQITLDKEKQPPKPLATLLSGASRFRDFKQNIRIYNCMFAMSSTGGKIDHSINRGGAPYCFKVKGVNYHSIGSFVPLDGAIPKFCQLYIYDTEDEVNNRINAVKGGNDSVDEGIVQSLLEMLDKYNRLVKGFRMARERIEHNAVDEFILVLIASPSASGRPNHIFPSNEVVGLIVTDDYPKHTQFVENEDPEEKGDREFITMKEYYNYKLMIRPSEGLTPHLGGRLWKLYVVDAFTAMEQYRLDWIRDNQKTIRSYLYHNIRDALQKGDSNPENVGKATILPASFTGSKRYMNQYFKDALAIRRMLGHPSMFLTMTTNTKWPEIQQMLKFLPGVNVVDTSDVVARVFKIKVDQMVDQIKNKNCFGSCIGVMHVKEF
ncbi:uncharacterized protein LOC141718757 [Apium graveolens]|uniref:uncharacterized protein LOC141718757 n=1 Tax=Apium graveolens TaxID=4045 RepID=UPI003D7B78FB